MPSLLPSNALKPRIVVRAIKAGANRDIASHSFNLFVLHYYHSQYNNYNNYNKKRNKQKPNCYL